MYLFELFNGGDDGSLIDDLRQRVMDYLTPLAAKSVEFIPIQHVADILHSANAGVVIDRGLVLRLIDPNDCKLVKEIQGDKVYLQLPMDDMSVKAEQDEEKDRDKIAKTAKQQAQKEIKR